LLKENQTQKLNSGLKLEFEPEFVNFLGEIKGEKRKVKPRTGIQIHGISSPRIREFNSGVFG
jgi:hypothetical protein